MDLEALRLFLCAAEEGSLLGAAKSGGVSRTTVRRKLEELESFVGVPLLVRRANGVSVTEAGDVLARRSQELLIQFDVLVNTTRDVALNPNRPLRFLTPVGVPAQGFSFCFRMLRQVWADVEIEFHTDQEAGAHGCGDYDICISLLRDVPEGPYETLKLQEVDEVLIASPDYLAQHPQITTPNDLLNHPILYWDPPDQTAYRLPCKNQPDLEIRPAFVTNDIQALHDMVAAGDGIAFCPHRNFLPDDGVKFGQVLADEVGSTRPISMLTSNAVAESPRIKFLMQVIHQFLQPHQSA